MDSFLDVSVQVMAYGDRAVSTNPRLRSFDWRRDVRGLAARNPRTDAVTMAPGESRLVFSGLRTTTLGPTTSFDVSASTLSAGRYRFDWVAGADPGLRVSHDLALSGIAVTVTLQSDGSAVFSVPAPALADFTGVTAGDILFVPHTTTGDVANVLSVQNSGEWVVLAALDSKHLSVARLPGQSFGGMTETATLTSNAQLRAYSSSGVQTGDKVSISAVFASATRHTFQVVAVTDSSFDVLSSAAIPLETSVEPGAAGMVFYSSSKSLVYVETDQECFVQCNGSIDQTQVVTPLAVGSPGLYLKTGPCWSIMLTNTSGVTLNGFISSVE